MCRGMLEISRERGVGIDVDGGAALDPLDDLQADVADRKRPVEQVEFVPGRPARDVHVGAKAQADGHAQSTRFSIGRQRCARLMIETTLRATSEKLWPSLREDSWRSLEVVGKIRREELLDGGAPLAPSRDRRAVSGHRPPSLRMVRLWRALRAVLEMGLLIAARRSLRISIRKWALGSQAGALDRSRSGRFRWRSGGRPEGLADIERRPRSAVPAERPLTG